MINFAGIASVVLFYLLILGVGMWAARKKPGGDDVDQEVGHNNIRQRVTRPMEAVTAS